MPRGPRPRLSGRPHPSLGTASAAALLAALAAACGEAPPEAAEPSAPGPETPAAPRDLSGVYQVVGRTVDQQTGDTRELVGTVVFQQEGERYTTRFEMKTEYPVEGGAIAADVLGDGSGRIAGDRLEGRSHTQLVLGTVPGVDTGFAFVPREVGPRIESRTQGSVLPDGTIEFEARNEPALEGGEGYRPTHTTLRATRVADIGPGDLEGVAAGPGSPEPDAD
jgi:hypothetical protein